MPLPISRRVVAWPTAPSRTGPLRQKRSSLIQSWSNPQRSAARARATQPATGRWLLTRRLKRIAGADDGFRLDLHEVGLAHEPGLDQGVGGPDAPEPLAVDARDRFPVLDPPDV